MTTQGKRSRVQQSEREGRQTVALMRAWAVTPQQQRRKESQW